MSVSIIFSFFSFLSFPVSMQANSELCAQVHRTKAIWNESNRMGCSRERATCVKSIYWESGHGCGCKNTRNRTRSTVSSCSLVCEKKTNSYISKSSRHPNPVRFAKLRIQVQSWVCAAIETNNQNVRAHTVDQTKQKRNKLFNWIVSNWDIQSISGKFLQFFIVRIRLWFAVAEFLLQSMEIETWLPCHSSGLRI